MNTLSKILVVLAVIMACGAGLVLWETTTMREEKEISTSISKEDMELILGDFDPRMLRTLSGSPENKNRLIKDLTETLAIAGAARKAGLHKDKDVKKALKHIEKRVTAAFYDMKVNRGKGPMPPFGFVSEDQIKAFWDEDKPSGGISWIWSKANGRWHESELKDFLKAELAIGARTGRFPAGRELPEEQLLQIRDTYARLQIMYYEAKEKMKSIPKMEEVEKKEWTAFKKKVELQTKLQQSQLLTALYTREKMAKAVAIKDKEVDKYIADHPELSRDAEQLKTAKDVLKKVQGGADFAELAKEYSDDPGSNSRGGLYEGVAKGSFAPEFEAAIDKLKVGEVYEAPVDTLSTPISGMRHQMISVH